MTIRSSGEFAGNLAFATGNQEQVRINPAGSVGIKVTNPLYTLHVNGNIYATGTVTESSDIRNKTNIVIIENPLNKVLSLRGVNYNRIDEANNVNTNAVFMGVVAQEVLNVVPEVVSGNNEIGYSVAYGTMVALLIEAIKEQNQKITELENLVISLRDS
jgi:hypothetical protein